MSFQGKEALAKARAVNLALSLALQGHKTELWTWISMDQAFQKLLHLTDKWPEVKERRLLITYESDLLKVMSMGFLLQGTEQAVIWRGPLKYSMIKDFILVQWVIFATLTVKHPPGTGDERSLGSSSFSKERQSGNRNDPTTGSYHRCRKMHYLLQTTGSFRSWHPSKT